jgi:hypothetical protein
VAIGLENKFFSRQLLRSWIPFLIAIIGIVVLCTLASPPFLSRAGDTFGCWYGYIQTWRLSGFAEALRQADATGRYPGYPFYLMIIQTFSQTDFLSTLMLSRVLGLILTFASLAIFFSKCGLDRFRSVFYGLFIVLIPMFWISIVLNSQDTIKVMFFVSSIIMVVELADWDSLSSRKKIYKYLLLSFFSIATAAARGPEILPFFVFAFFYCWFLRKSLAGAWKPFFRMTLPSFSFLLMIHLYGKTVVGHYGLSGPHVPSSDVWPRMVLGHGRDMGFNFFEQIWNLVSVAVITFLNKVGYIVEDFVFNQGETRILDVHFVGTLQRVSLLRTFLYYPVGIAISGFLVWLCFRKNSTFLVKSLIWSAFSTAAFYLYSLNHYEPRYWLLFVVASLMAVFIQFGKAQKVFWITVIILCAVELPSAYIDHQNDMEIDKDVRALAEKWKADAKTDCDKKIKAVYAPGYYLKLTAFRYLTAENCPTLAILPIEGADMNSYPSAEISILPYEYFENSHLIGFSNNKFTF